MRTSLSIAGPRPRIANAVNRAYGRTLIWALLLTCACAPARGGVPPSAPGGMPGPGVHTGIAASCGFRPPPLGAFVTADLHITEVVPTLPADRAGLQPGDLILAIEGTPVTSVAEAKQALDTAAASRAGPCNDTASIALDSGGRVIATSAPIPTPTPGPGVRVTVRRGSLDLPLPVNLRWPVTQPNQPTATSVPSNRPYL